jgi:hypothetical protein
MRRLNILMFLSLIAGAVQAQFINNGATVTIQPGATLRVETDFINNSGTVTNSGTLEVQGNFDNNATFTSTDPSIVRFIGTADANASTGGAVLRNVEMSKNGGDVVLLGENMSIAGTLNFNGDDTRIVTGAQSLILPTSADITGVDANEYVATTGVGRLIKSVSGNATVNLEVGDLVNYTPVSSAVTGTTYTAATLGGRAIIAPDLTAKYGDASDYISREWQIAATGIAGYANTMTGTYVAGDVVGMSSLVKGATFHTADWRFDGSSSGASTVIASTTNTDVRLSGKNFFGRVNLKVLLQGAYSDFSGQNSTGLMSSALRSANLIPLVSPYSDAPATALSIPADVTDWVKIEIRDASNSNTVLGRASVFLKNNGSLVAIDGSSNPLIKNGNPMSIVSVHHRNHLPIRTAAALDISKIAPTLYDFTSDLMNAFDSPSVANDAMKLVIGTGGNAGINSWTMWAGNGSGNNRVRYSGSTEDLNYLLNTLSTDPAPFTGLSGNTAGNINNIYSNSDYNMDGRVRYSGSTHDVSFLLNVVLGGLTNGSITQSL